MARDIVETLNAEAEARHAWRSEVVIVSETGR